MSNETTEISEKPKRNTFRRGCCGCFMYCIIAVLLAAFPFYRICIYIPPLKISRETTYLTHPLTPDGKRIDYILALEEQLCPPEMKTDKNGFRLLVEKCGFMVDDVPSEELRLQVYEKLGLDPNIKPEFNSDINDWSFTHYLKEMIEKLEDEKEKAKYEKLEPIQYNVQPFFWTLEEYPLLKDWIEKIDPLADCISEAVRKDCFVVPLIVQEDERGKMMINLTSYLWAQREFARILCARAKYRLGIGDIDGAMNDKITIHRLARTSLSRHFLTGGLVGIALEGMGHSIGIAGNPNKQPDNGQLERLDKELAALPPMPAFSDIMQSERLFCLNEIQKFAGRIDLDWMIDAFGEHRPLLGYVKYLTIADANIQMSGFNKMFDAVIKTGDYTQTPLSDSDFYHIRNMTVNGRSHTITRIFTRLLLPSLMAARVACERSGSGANLQKLTLALLRFENEHKKLPEGDWRKAVLPYLGKDGEKYFRCPRRQDAAGESDYALLEMPTDEPLTPETPLLVEMKTPQKLGEGTGRIANDEVLFTDRYHSTVYPISYRSGAVSIKNKKIKE